MELESTIDSFSVIRVAVLAIGQMPPVQLRDYVDMVAQYTRVDLRSVRSFYTEHQKSPFTQQPWETGELRLKFMVGGAVRSPWEEFQVHRKIHGVIGLCHCPFSHDLAATYEQFATICSAYPFAQVKRCFAFHPSDIQVEQDKSKWQDFILFPPADRETLEFHMQTLIQEFAAGILMEFEKRVLLADPLASTLTTPLDSQASAGTEEASKSKKKRLGRLQKTIGDYCLLAGSHLDAAAHYLTAIDLCRLTGDVFWHAGAAEGSMGALMANRKRDQPPTEEVKGRYSEIIQLYRRATVLPFELDASLKLAKLLCRKELAKDVVEVLSSSIESGKSLLEANDRLVLFVEVARIYGALGYSKKAAFFSREVAHLYLQQDNHWAALSALQVLRLVSNAYQLSPPQLDGPVLAKAIQSAESNQGSWSTLQIDILGDMLACAIRGGDALSAWRAAAQLLRGHYPLITPGAQISLAKALATAAAKLPRGTRAAHPALPFIRLHSFCQQTLHLGIIQRKPGKTDWWNGSSSSGPFIYTPLSTKQKTVGKPEMTWVVGEPIQVVVEVSNPCAFEVFVENICLSVAPGEFEAFPFSFVLPPNGSELVPLSGRPLSSGSVIVRGCFVQCHGIVTEHTFGVTKAETGLLFGDPFRNLGGLKQRKEKPLPDIKVIPPLPSVVADIREGEGAIILYEGEVRNLTVELCNVGTVPVVEATMSLVGRRCEQLICVEDEVLQAALPLNGGEKVSVPVKIQTGRLDTQSEKRTSVELEAASEILLHVLIHYAGPPVQEDMEELSPGRGLSIPLQLRILQGLRLVKARLLSMEIPLQLSRSLPGDATCKSDANAVMKMDPYRGSWNLRLLELELWNGTDILFEVAVSIKGKELDAVYAGTRIDRDRCARVLVPLEKFKLATLDKSFFARAQHKSAENASEHTATAKNEVSSTVEELCSRICVNWSSGKHSTGELQLKDAVREALRESVFEILLPDPLTFGFRLAKVAQKDASSPIFAHELTPIEMLVKNNTTEDISVTLSVSCRDVTGASCLAEHQRTIIWAGAIDGVDVELSALGEAVHRFELCFLVPGEYTLLGAAVISASHDDARESVCYCGPPFTVQVAGFT